MRWDAARAESRRPLPKPHNFWSHVDIRGVDDCWPWKGWRVARGYGRIRKPGSKYASLYAHRVAYELSTGPIADGLVTRHRCDNRLCCNPAHLELGTNADNTADMLSRERQSRGSRSPHAKLNEELVRQARASNEMTERLAERFGVCPETLSRARRGLTWKHVR